MARTPRRDAPTKTREVNTRRYGALGDREHRYTSARSLHDAPEAQAYRVRQLHARYFTDAQTAYTGPTSLMPARGYTDKLGAVMGAQSPQSCASGDALLYQSPALRVVTECMLAGATGGLPAYLLACQYAGLRPLLPLDETETGEYTLAASHLTHWLDTPYGARHWSGLLSAWVMRCLMHAQAVTVRTEVRATLTDATDAAPISQYRTASASWSSYLEASLLAVLDDAIVTYGDKPGDVSLLLAYRQALDVQEAIQRAVARAARQTYFETEDAYQRMRDDGSVSSRLLRYVLAVRRAYDVPRVAVRHANRNARRAAMRQKR